MTEVVVVDRSVHVSSQAAFDPAVEFKSWFWRFWLLNHFLRFLVLLAVRSLRNLGTRTWSRGGLLCVAPTRSQSISNNQDCRSKSSRSLSLIHGSSTTLVGYKKSMFLSVRKLSASLSVVMCGPGNVSACRLLGWPSGCMRSIPALPSSIPGETGLCPEAEGHCLGPARLRLQMWQDIFSLENQNSS